MIDIVYIVGAVVFFALMLAYVAACAWLGRAGSDSSRTESHR